MKSVVSPLSAAKPVVSARDLVISRHEGNSTAENPVRSRLAAAFLKVCRRSPLGPAFILPDRSYSFEQVAAAASAVASRLADVARWQVGDRVALQIANSTQYASAFYGVLLAGGVVVALPPVVETQRRAGILSSAGCKLLLKNNPGDALLPELLTTGISNHADGSNHGVESLAAIFFTSGSTGQPKGVMLTDENLLSNSRSICEYLKIVPEDRALAALPFYHAFGNSVLQSHLLSGATLVIDGSMTFPETIVEAMQRHRVTSFSGVPEFFQSLLKHSRLGSVPLPDLRYAAVAGGSLRPELALEVAEKIAPAELYVMYGQTEATARLSYLPPEFLRPKAGSIGRGIPGVKLEVVDDAGQRVQSGQVGQIRARGPNIMAGYWNDVDTTTKTIRDGWLYTGDLASVDDEGFVFPQGRANGLCKIAGYRVHPVEVESVVTAHFPRCDAVVVPFETTEQGTRLALFVCPLDEEVSVDISQLRATCLKSLPRYQFPVHIELLEQWPLTSACKIDRVALTQRAQSHTISNSSNQDKTS